MEKTSFKSKIYRAVIRITGIKKIIEKEFQTDDFSRNNKAAAIPDNVQRQCDVLHRKSATGRSIWELRKKNTETQQYILYLHGGAFVHNITKYDWELLNMIVQYTGYGIIVPDYPLAPEHNYKEVYSMVAPIYQELLQHVGSESVVLMGFSAGGGLALSLAQYAKEKSMAQPSQIILLSPLLDARLLNPEIVDIDKHDPYLDIGSLKKALLAYSGGDDVGNYMISPINGPIEGLAPIHLFIGTHEILLPDARKLVVLAKEKNVQIEYHEYPKMYHAWVFLNMPEAKNVFVKLVNILR
jgi:acetyl esterase/lipase